MTAEEVVRKFGSDARRGQEADACLGRYGPNELKTGRPAPAWRRFLAQFGDVLAILLLVAHWFENREPAPPRTIGTPVPASVYGLLAPFRVLGV